MGELPVPGILMGAYPERRRVVVDAFARAGMRARQALAALGGWRARRYARFVRAVRTCEAGHAGAHVEHQLAHLRVSLARDGFTERHVIQAFRIASDACARTLGIRLYDSQLMAARIMLDGRLAEMATGEGKTVAAALCAATAALAGVPVHVITANDYLVGRDAEALRPLYRALGLTVGFVTQDSDELARREAYNCDVTYCTAKDLVFDYLRDRLVRERLRSDLHLRAERLGSGPGAPPSTLLRGLCMALVDEADCTLIDEARVPLILSESRANGAAEHYRRALELARALVPGEHYRLDATALGADLTDTGRTALAQSGAAFGGLWRNRREREETVCTALAALHLYVRDRHYLVQDGAVAVIDETTGRVAPGRMWARGLHQLVECKEGLQPASELVTIAQITYQRFFARYLRLCGMSGTLSEARGELCSVYGLETVKVPLERPCLRRVLPARVYRDADALWRAVVARVREVSRSGRPVLVGTDSVLESETLSQHLRDAGLAHAVLNARHDRDEAQIVAHAGAPGQITVTTNMAGRGTDIPLAAESAGRGGLHLVCCQHNASRRIDRQLLGRCARRGDPGSAETLLALNKPLIARLFPACLHRFCAQDGMVLPAWAAALVLRLPQRLEELRLRRARRALLEQDVRAERRSLIGSSAE